MKRILIAALMFAASTPAFAASTNIEIHVRCLADNIYYEAGNQGEKGMIAVSKVVINRTNDPRFPSTICEVVKQRSKGKCQFTWVCSKANRHKDVVLYAKAREVAERVLTQDVEDPTKGSLFFHSGKVKAFKRKMMVKIGNHIFYK